MHIMTDSTHRSVFGWLSFDRDDTRFAMVVQDIVHTCLKRGDECRHGRIVNCMTLPFKDGLCRFVIQTHADMMFSWIDSEMDHDSYNGVRFIDSVFFSLQQYSLQYSWYCDESWMMWFYRPPPYPGGSMMGA